VPSHFPGALLSFRAMHPARVSVNLGSRSYDVVIGRDILGQLRAVLEKLRPSSLFLVSDDNVAPLHSGAIRASVAGLAELHELNVPAGEGSKSQTQLARLYDAALATRAADRHSVVIALGGGVVGDLAGYFAATLMRGVPWVQVPTSLLAMVDSSVGGKVAINHSAGKNLIGAFYQPSAVICELEFLRTLPAREYVSALAEVVKTSMLGNAALSQIVATRSPEILSRESAVVTKVVAECVISKAAVVSQDEHETTGLRAVLNMGHTLAHVLETAFPDRYLHGEAVSIGLVAALRVSVARAGLGEPVNAAVIATLKAFGLPVDPPADLSIQRTLELLASDKKREGAKLNFVVYASGCKLQLLQVRPDAEFAALLLGRAHG